MTSAVTYWCCTIRDSKRPSKLMKKAGFVLEPPDLIRMLQKMKTIVEDLEVLFSPVTEIDGEQVTAGKSLQSSRLTLRPLPGGIRWKLLCWRPTRPDPYTNSTCSSIQRSRRSALTSTQITDPPPPSSFRKNIHLSSIPMSSPPSNSIGGSCSSFPPQHHSSTPWLTCGQSDPCHHSNNGHTLEARAHLAGFLPRDRSDKTARPVVWARNGTLCDRRGGVRNDPVIRLNCFYGGTNT